MTVSATLTSAGRGERPDVLLESSLQFSGVTIKPREGCLWNQVELLRHSVGFCASSGENPQTPALTVSNEAQPWEVPGDPWAGPHLQRCPVKQKKFSEYCPGLANVL